MSEVQGREGAFYHIRAFKEAVASVVWWSWR